jgi:heme-degrading monooxygenase HmoA
MTTSWKNGTPPKAPFYAVIFISRKSENLEGYATTDEAMMQLAQQQEGYLGYTSESSADGGVFISYWQSEKHIAIWRKDEAHKEAKSKAQQWYRYYHSMICKVESSHVFDVLRASGSF